MSLLLLFAGVGGVGVVSIGRPPRIVSISALGGRAMQAGEHAPLILSAMERGPTAVEVAERGPTAVEVAGLSPRIVEVD